MSCSQSQSPLTADDSSDYGSDFTLEQEALVDELLAKVATENAPSTTNADTGPTAAVATAVVIDTRQTQIGDIEDHYASSQSSPRVPRVLGREKSGATYQFRKMAATLSPGPVGVSDQGPDDAGTALG